MTMYREKAYDTNLSNLFAMWQKEGGMSTNASGPASGVMPGATSAYDGTSTQRSGYQSRSKTLPPPAELAQRIEEARTSAKLLQQLIQSTPQADLRSNDLIKEFADRCQSAQRSIQNYISADNPMPDDNTMQTLIETSEQLGLAMSKHSRALLQARRAAAGSGGNSPLPTPPLPPVRPEDQLPDRVPHTSATYAPSGVSPELSTYSPPPLPPPSIPRRDVATNHPPSSGPTYTYSPPPLPPPGKISGPIDEDPFADEHAMEDAHNVPAGLRPGLQNITSSYVRRQDDAEENHTMHGARDSTPVSPEQEQHNHADRLVVK
jgi:GAT domain